MPALFEDIADAIRDKTGDAAQITADDFPTAIEAISAGVALAPTKTASGGGSTTLSFSGLLAEPKFFVVYSEGSADGSDNNYVVTMILYDGTNFTGGAIYYRSDMASWGNPSFSKAWNNNTKTLTITVTSSSRIFKSGKTYTLLYAY